MPRVKLAPLPAYASRHELRVRVADLNYANHLAHDCVARYAQEGRAAFLRERGFGELDLGEPGLGLIMADLAVNYRAEGRLHDLLLVESGVSELSRSSFRFCSRITRAGELLALVEAGMLAFNYDEQRPARLPEAFRAALEAAAA